MPAKFVTAFKKNENDFRKKVIVIAGITVAAIAAGVVLSKMKDSTENVILVFEEAADTAATALPE